MPIPWTWRRQLGEMRFPKSCRFRVQSREPTDVTDRYSVVVTSSSILISLVNYLFYLGSRFQRTSATKKDSRGRGGENKKAVSGSLCFCRPVCRFTCQSVYLSIYLSICLSVYLSVLLPIMSMYNSESTLVFSSLKNHQPKTLAWSRKARWD